MKLKILRFDANELAHICSDEEGKEHRVDILVDGGIDTAKHSDEALIGRTVEVSFLTPFVEIAHDVRLID